MMEALKSQATNSQPAIPITVVEKEHSVPWPLSVAASTGLMKRGYGESNSIRISQQLQTATEIEEGVLNLDADDRCMLA
jgi:hypothetical protein